MIKLKQLLVVLLLSTLSFSFILPSGIAYADNGWTDEPTPEDEIMTIAIPEVSGRITESDFQYYNSYTNNDSKIHYFNIYLKRNGYEKNLNGFDIKAELRLINSKTDTTLKSSSKLWTATPETETETKGEYLKVNVYSEGDKNETFFNIQIKYKAEGESEYKTYKQDINYIGWENSEYGKTNETLTFEINCIDPNTAEQDKEQAEENSGLLAGIKNFFDNLIEILKGIYDGIIERLQPLFDFFDKAGDFIVDLILPSDNMIDFLRQQAQEQVIDKLPILEIPYDIINEIVNYYTPGAHQHYLGSTFVIPDIKFDIGKYHFDIAEFKDETYADGLKHSINMNDLINEQDKSGGLKSIQKYLYLAGDAAFSLLFLRYARRKIGNII